MGGGGLKRTSVGAQPIRCRQVHAMYNYVLQGSGFG